MSATRYQAAFVDLDGTIFDTASSLRLALLETLEGAGVEPTDELVAQFHEINNELWRSVERGERTANDVNVARFAYLVSSAGLDVDPQGLADTFPSGLARYGELYDGAAEVLATLADAVPLVLVTNGIGEIQRGRIERLGLDRYFRDWVISGEVNVAKPDPEIFAMALAKIDGLKPNQVVMIGDNLDADCGGASAAGLDSVWVVDEAPDRAPDPGPTDTVTDLDQVVPIVLGANA